jgi:hypothetical protein
VKKGKTPKNLPLKSQNRRPSTKKEQTSAQRNLPPEGVAFTLGSRRRRGPLPGILLFEKRKNSPPVIPTPYQSLQRMFDHDTGVECHHRGEERDMAEGEREV